ncbi:MAG: hypothetical protein LWW95_02935 [Candidatus Desulfofervidus auxilii]|nr:hypothetical protein [Candidatus Desulfofervidus auxilii]
MIEEIKNKYESKFMAIDGVVGVGIGKTKDGVSCIKVYVKEKTTEIEKLIPNKVEGINVEIEEIGEISAL